MTFDQAPDVLNVKEAAELARIGRNQLYEACRRGDIWSCTIGRSIRIPKIALGKYLGLVATPAGEGGPVSSAGPFSPTGLERRGDSAGISNGREQPPLAAAKEDGSARRPVQTA